MGQYRLKEIIYSNGSSEYIIQKSYFFGLIYIDLDISTCNYYNNINKAHIVDINNITKFTVPDKFKGFNVIEWLSTNRDNICLKYNDTILYAFKDESHSYTFHASDSLDYMITIRNKIKKHKTQINYYVYDKKVDEFREY